MYYLFGDSSPRRSISSPIVCPRAQLRTWYDSVSSWSLLGAFKKLFGFLLKPPEVVAPPPVWYFLATPEIDVAPLFSEIGSRIEN